MGERWVVRNGDYVLGGVERSVSGDEMFLDWISEEPPPVWGLRDCRCCCCCCCCCC